MRHLLRIERLAVERELGVELAGPPALQHLLHRRNVDAEQRRERREVRRRGDDLADVEVAVGPAVEATTDAKRHGVVHRRMTQRALDADRLQRTVGVEESGQAEDRIRLQQCERTGRAVQIELTALHAALYAVQRFGVDLEAEIDCLPRRNAGAYAAER